MPWRFFALGGTYDFANLVPKPAEKCMRVYGPVAQVVSRSSDGTTLRITGWSGIVRAFSYWCRGNRIH